MDEDFRVKIEAKLAEFRDWSHGRNICKCRLVQYCGHDLTGAIDVLPSEVEKQIEGLLCEAFYVDWAEIDGCLYLRVWEFGGPEPEWPKVFAEQPLIDIEMILRESQRPS